MSALASGVRSYSLTVLGSALAASRPSSLQFPDGPEPQGSTRPAQPAKTLLRCGPSRTAVPHPSNRPRPQRTVPHPPDTEPALPEPVHLHRGPVGRRCALVFLARRGGNALPW